MFASVRFAGVPALLQRLVAVEVKVESNWDGN